MKENIGLNGGVVKGGGLIVMEKSHKKLVLISWFLMLLVSALPNIILREVFNTNLPWLPYIKIGVLLLLFVISVFYDKLSPLRHYFGVFLMVFVTTESIKALRATEHWKKWFGGSSPSFVQYMVRMQLLLILGFFIIFFVLFLIKKNPSKFYFSMGDLNAKVKPVKWLAVQDNIYWKGLGSEFGIYLSIGILIYLLFANGIPAINDLMQVVRYIPLIIIFAAINSVYEELVYRASLLSVLESVIGERHALSITTLYFGIGHFYGAPAGIIGIIMSSLLGYILGKSMIETRGVFLGIFTSLFYILFKPRLVGICIKLFIKFRKTGAVLTGPVFYKEKIDTNICSNL